MNREKTLSLVVMLVDIRHPLQPADEQMLEWLTHYSIPFVLVLTKADKLSKSRQLQMKRSITEEVAFWGKPPVFTVSSEKRQGTEELLGVLIQ